MGHQHVELACGRGTRGRMNAGWYILRVMNIILCLTIYIWTITLWYLWCLFVASSFRNVGIRVRALMVSNCFSYTPSQQQLIVINFAYFWFLTRLLRAWWASAQHSGVTVMLSSRITGLKSVVVSLDIFPSFLSCKSYTAHKIYFDIHIYMRNITHMIHNT